MSPGEGPRIAVVGVGAVGSVVGGLLACAGHDVTLVDQWPGHVEAIQRSGLALSGTCGDHVVEVPALHIHQLQSVTDPFDIVLLAVKSYDTDWATTLASGYLKPDGVVATLQNGINDHRVAEIVGPERTLGVVTLIGVAMDTPGAAVKTDRDPVGFRVGEYTGTGTVRAERLVDVLGAVAGGVVTENLWGERWSKLALNCMVNPLAALTGYGAAEVRLDPDCQRLGVVLGSEAAKVGRAVGHDIELVFGMPAQQLIDAGDGPGLQAATAKIAAGAEARGNGWPSMLQDVRKGRRTEVDYLNGYVARTGAEHGVATPLNDGVVAEFAALGTQFTPDPSRIRPLVEILDGVHGART